MRRQIITNRKRPNRNITEIVPVILDTIRAKRIENEKRILHVIKNPIKNDSRELIHLSLKNPVLLQHPSETYASKVISNNISKSSICQINIMHHLREKFCSDWIDPTLTDIISGKRDIIDFFEMAIIDELSHIHCGWSIYMDFINGQSNKGQLQIIKECIERGIRKRPWIFSRREEQLQMQIEDIRSGWGRIAISAAERAINKQEKSRIQRIENYMKNILEHPYYIELEERQEIPGAWAYYCYKLELQKNFNDDGYITDIDDFTDCMSYESL